jgi:hypothetical protein
MTLFKFNHTRVLAHLPEMRNDQREIHTGGDLVETAEQEFDAQRRAARILGS